MSYALHPYRSVASKNGDRRYQGPKYSVVDVGVVVVVAMSPSRQPKANIEPRFSFRCARDRSRLLRRPHRWPDALPMRRSAALAAAVLSLAAVAVMAVPAGATTTVSCGSQNLQAKINAAPAGSTLLVKGTCVGNFVIGKSLTLQGNPTATLDGNQASHTVLISGTHTVHLANLTITRGLATTGGGIQASAGKLFLVHVTVSDDYASGTTAQGGGIFFGNGTLSIASSVIRNDVAAGSSSGTANALGGGILIEKGTLTIAGSTIRNNRVVAT